VGKKRKKFSQKLIAVCKYLYFKEKGLAKKCKSFPFVRIFSHLPDRLLFIYASTIFMMGENGERQYGFFCPDY